MVTVVGDIGEGGGFYEPDIPPSPPSNANSVTGIYYGMGAKVGGGGARGSGSEGYIAPIPVSADYLSPVS